MTLANPQHVSESINSILSAAVDENRAVSLNEKFQLNTLFESLYNANKSIYHSYYADYAAFTGEMKALDMCVNYFFALKKDSELNQESIRCLFALNNAAYFEKLHGIIKDYDVVKYRIPELVKVYLNASIMTLNVNDAERLFIDLHQHDDFIGHDQMHLYAKLIQRTKDFLSSYDDKACEQLQKYICNILKTHRNYIVRNIYKTSGPSILHPTFLNDEGRGYLSLTLEYVSEDVDYALDLEALFYDKLGFEGYDSSILSAVSYNLLPISPKDPLTFVENVIEVGGF